MASPVLTDIAPLTPNTEMSVPASADAIVTVR